MGPETWAQSWGSGTPSQGLLRAITSLGLQAGLSTCQHQQAEEVGRGVSWGREGSQTFKEDGLAPAPLSGHRRAPRHSGEDALPPAPTTPNKRHSEKTVS